MMSILCTMEMTWYLLKNKHFSFKKEIVNVKFKLKFSFSSAV